MSIPSSTMEKEKQPKHKGHNKLLKFLPKSAAIVTFQSPPISPGKIVPGKPVSGRVGSIVPKEARRRLKNGSFDAREPASPMVSCVGQVKSKKNNKAKTKQQMLHLAKEFREIELIDNNPKEVKKCHSSNILKFFKGNKFGKKSDNVDTKVSGPPMKVPQLGHMKQFASGRGVLTNFDWRAYGVAVVPDCAADCSPEEEKDEKNVVIPHSAPIVVVEEEIEIKPRKEINLWKRRTMARPPPLRL